MANGSNSILVPVRIVFSLLFGCGPRVTQCATLARNADRIPGGRLVRLVDPEGIPLLGGNGSPAVDR